MNYSRPAPIVDGEFVKAAVLNQSLVTNMAESFHRLAYRSVDLAKTNDVVPILDPQLSFVVNAEELWYFEAHCRFFSAADDVPNILMKWSFPTPGELVGYGFQLATGGVTYQMNVSVHNLGLGDTEQYWSGITPRTVMSRQLLFARTAGTVGVTWSQSTTSASHTTMMKGSNIMGCKVGSIPSGAATPFIT
jgi:hypothetical protein